WLVGLTRLRANREDDRVGLAGVRRPLRTRIANQQDGAVRAVDLLAVDVEPRMPGDDDVELLVSGRDLLVLAGDRLLGLARPPGVDAERLDAEVLANRRPPPFVLELGDVRSLIRLLGHVSPSLSSADWSDVSFTFDA